MCDAPVAEIDEVLRCDEGGLLVAVAGATAEEGLDAVAGDNDRESLLVKLAHVLAVDGAHVGDDQAVDALAAHEVHEGARPLELLVRRFEQHLVAMSMAAVVDGAQQARQVGVV